MAEKSAQDFVEKVIQARQTPLSPEEISAAARKNYGNLSVARRWLESATRLRAEKDRRRAFLERLDWEKLYEDNLDILSNPGSDNPRI
jgi:hypothetical protein